MNFSEITLGAREALNLLAAYPVRWLILVVVFLAVVESLMFIPYVGFVAKLSLAGLLSAQVLVMFAAASSGRPPQLQSLLGVFSLPLSAQLVLASAALLPFLAGLAYLIAQGDGWNSIAFFFSNILKAKPPAPDVFFIFKNVMYVAALPLTFIAAAVTLRGLSGWNAVVQGITAGLHNWSALLVIFVLSVVFEWSVGKLAVIPPRPLGAALSGVLLVAFLAWSFSFLYTLSVRAYGIAPGATAKTAT